MSHTTCITPAAVYLHPAAASDARTIRAIERTTQRLACPDVSAGNRRIRLVELTELATVLRLPGAGGAA
ncbi:hypothetical protein MKP05_09535 [Halomonas sp. EGI 63088]|uniref:Uncharacterized protein n=1 Tax=Halomonas flagellata TaxID=2920385 RepID=A0ABS9RU66_9GAMM|nr:hypothetical protein [Halomonas flagellata]MCH4563371.1 hypothetical protein [Halomonas flagellata]